MNNWNIKISDSGNGIFSGSIENNGELVAKISTTNSFDKALSQARGIIFNRIKFYDVRNKSVKNALALFYNKYIKSHLYMGINGATVKKDAKGSPYIEVQLDTTNDKLVRQIPEYITDPKTHMDFKIEKV